MRKLNQLVQDRVSKHLRFFFVEFGLFELIWWSGESPPCTRITPLPLPIEWCIWCRLLDTRPLLEVALEIGDEFAANCMCADCRCDCGTTCPGMLPIDGSSE